MPFPIVVFWNPAYISPTVSEIFNVECNAMIDMTLMRPLNKGQGHSFWYQSISEIRLPTSFLPNSNFGESGFGESGLHLNVMLDFAPPRPSPSSLLLSSKTGEVLGLTPSNWGHGAAEVPSAYSSSCPAFVSAAPMGSRSGDRYDHSAERRLR